MSMFLRPYRLLFTIAAVLLIFGTLVIVGKALLANGGSRFRHAQEYPALARGIVSGHLFLDTNHSGTVPLIDWGEYGNQITIPFGVLPAAFFIPFLPFFSDVIPPQVVTVPLLLIAASLVYRIARKKNLTPGDARWVAVAYTLGSAVLPPAFGYYSSWLAMLGANVFLLVALHEFLNRKRWPMIGAALGVAFLCRSVSILGVGLFVGIHALIEREAWHKKIRSLLQFTVPIAIGALITAAYNFGRFGTPWEVGYSYQWLNDTSGFLKTNPPMSVRYIGRNLRHFLTDLPVLTPAFPYLIPGQDGLSVFIGSPWLLSLVRTDWRTKENMIAVCAAAIGLLPAFLFWADGVFQVGYRYALDIYPLLLLLFISSLRGRMPRIVKILIIVAAGLQLVWTFVAGALL